jgi:predicted nucleic acid-binding Zn ribbon protein
VVASRLTGRDLTGLAAVQKAWASTVEPSVQEVARPLKLSGSTLVIAVDQPSLATQVRLKSGQVLKQLNAASGLEITGIEVVVRKA